MKLFMQLFELFKACYKFHGPKPWIWKPFCVFSASFLGRNVQKNHHQPNLRASEALQQKSLHSYLKESYQQPAHLVLKLSTLPRAFWRRYENQETKTIFVLEIFSFFRTRASLIWIRGAFEVCLCSLKMQASHLSNRFRLCDNPEKFEKMYWTKFILKTYVEILS